MSDIDDAMEETQEKAKSKFGIGGSGTTDTGSEDTTEEPAVNESTSTTETQGTSETLETGETEETEETSKTEDEADAESSSKERGRLIDEYENINIYVPEELKDELNFLFKQIDVEYSRETGGDLEKHWDFYPAVVRTVLRNEDDLREELGIE